MKKQDEKHIKEIIEIKIFKVWYGQGVVLYGPVV